MTKTKSLSCLVCKKYCYNNQKCIHCNECQNKVHYKCTKHLFTSKSNCFENFKQQFLCKKCNNTIFPFTNLNDSEFATLFQDNHTKSNNTQKMIEKIRSTDFHVSSDTKDHEIEENHCDYTNLHKFSKLLNQANSKSDLSLVHFNMRSLPKNLHKIEDLLLSSNTLPKILAISETKLNPKKVYNVNLNNYSFQHNDSSTQAGGVGLFILKDIKYLIREDLSMNIEGCEDLWIEIITPQYKKNIIVSVIYRHSYCNIEVFQNKLCNILKSISSYQYIICGDTNIDLLKYDSNHQISNYLNEIYSLGATVAINKPTRLTDSSATLIDHIYTNNLRKNVPAGILIYEVSDHLPVYIVFKEVIKIKHQKFIHRDTRKFDVNSYRNKMFEKLNENYNKLKHDKQKFLYSDFADIFCNVLNSHAPLKQTSRKDLKFKNKPWLTSGIIKSIKTKNKLFKDCYKSNDPYLVCKYKQYTNKLTKIKNAAKTAYYKEKLMQTKNDISKQWKIINEIIGRKRKCINSNIPSKIVNHQTGKQISCPQEICNEFNTFFTHIGQSISNTISVPSTTKNLFATIPQCKPSFFFTPISANEILIEIGQLQDSKSPGLDKIHNKFLKCVSDIIAPFLAESFNNHVNVGKFPDELKIAKIVPVYKNGSRTLTTNYRPISILSTFAKIFEKCIYIRLYDYFSSKNLFSSEQFGFRQKHSTTLAVTDIYNRILHNAEQKKFTCALFLDLKKAFDTVNHSMLLQKLNKYGIRGNTHDLISDYLTNRSQFTVMRETISNPNTLITGVPQGSTLGPLLFLVYINDLPLCTKFSLRLFADDTCLIMSDTNINTLNKNVNLELDRVYCWLNQNKLKLNFEKSNYMLFKPYTKKLKDNDTFEILLENNIKIKQVTSTKYLGIVFDEQLNWTDQIHQLCKKLAQACGIIRTIKPFLNYKTLLSVYYCIVYSHLQYGIIIWGNANKTKLLKLNNLHNKIIKLIKEKIKRENKPKLEQLTPLLSIEQIFKLEIGKFMFRYYNKQLPICFLQYFKTIDSIHNYSTRLSKQNNYFLPRYRLKQSQKLLTYSGAKLWSEIPSDIKKLSFKNFTKKLKTYLTSDS